MSRATLPVAKFAPTLRSITSSAKAARSSTLLDSQARVSKYLPQNVRSLKAECVKRGLSKTGSKAELVDRLAVYDIAGSHGFHQAAGAGQRPITHVTKPIVYKTGHLMQGFKTSAVQRAARDTSTIDFFYFPEAHGVASNDSYQTLRVPLLPDNYNPDRSPKSAHAVEALDTAVPRPEISIMSSHPESIVPATISEVVGNDSIDISLDKLTAGFSETVSEIVKDIPEPSALKQLWLGVLDDIFGPKAGSKAA